MTADTPRCTACQAGAVDSPATHRVSMVGVRPDHKPELACLFHALPGDLPLDGVTDEMLARAFAIPTTHPRPGRQLENDHE